MTTPNELEPHNVDSLEASTDLAQSMIMDDVNHKTDTLLELNQELNKTQSLGASIVLSVMGLVRRVTAEDVQEFSKLSDLKTERARIAKEVNDSTYNQAA